MFSAQTKLRILAAFFLAFGTATLPAQQPAFQQPPQRPQVSYSHGVLSVVANNSTYADILDAIQNALGTTIDGVTPTSTERIFGKFGPASPGAVLHSVLSGSPYDFIVVGSESGGPIQEIILSPRNGGGSHMQVAANQPSQPVNNNNNNNGYNNNGYNGAVSDQFSYRDPQWSVPQYKAPEVVQTPNPGQSNIPGQPGYNPYNQNNPYAQNGQYGQNGAQPSATPWRPQHWGALYSPQNPPPPPPPYNPSAMNPNQAPQQ